MKKLNNMVISAALLALTGTVSAQDTLELTSAQMDQVTAAGYSADASSYAGTRSSFLGISVSNNDAGADAFFSQSWATADGTALAVSYPWYLGAEAYSSASTQAVCTTC